MGTFLHRSAFNWVLLSVSFLLLYLSQVYPHTTREYPTSVLYNISNSTQACLTSIGIEYSLLIFLPAILLGSNYILLKRYNQGDGVFFQWLVCAGLWICGLIVNFIQTPTHFYVFAMIGGVIWCSGNFLIIPMIRLVGFNTGVLIWSLVFMGTGWSTGLVYLVGVPPDRLCVPFLNYGGLVMCISGVILLAFLKDKKSISIPIMRRSYSTYNDLYITMAPVSTPHNKAMYEGWWIVNRLIGRLSPFKKKVIGYALSILMGIAWGTHFLPMQILLVLATRDSYYSARALDYIFPYATGVLITSTLVTALYSVYMCNKPIILAQSILPALTVGVLTGVAISLWAYLNQVMTPAIAFPIIATGTPTVGFLTSVIAYRGWKNVFILFVSVFVILFGTCLVLLSKVHPFPVFASFPYDNNIV